MCDCKVIIIKGYVWWYVNEGNDVLIVVDFKDVILFYGGVSGVRVVFVDIIIDEIVVI